MTAVLVSRPASLLETSSPAATTAEHLPSYNDVRVAHLAPELRPDPYVSERSFFVRTTKGVPWLTVTLKSRATSAKYLPLYCERDVIRGTVTLDLQADISVKDIVLKVLTVSEQGANPRNGFVHNAIHYIWRPEGGAPYAVLPKGRHVMPINFPIPREVSNPKQPSEMIALPPTFSERGGNAVSIDYTLSVSLRKPGLQISRKITTAVGYYPRSVCKTPSLLRLLAYHNNTSLMGPELDALGWKVLPSVSLQGTVIDGRTVNIEYTLAIAEPLSYAVGGSIPLFLTVRSIDARAFDLATSGANVQLRRVREDLERRGSAITHDVARAVFWPYTRNTQAHEEGICKLQGEVVIPRGTTPSFTFMNIALRYDIILCGPMISGSFPILPKAPMSTSKPLRSATIVIAAASPRHLEPLLSLPPAYAN